MRPNLWSLNHTQQFQLSLLLHVVFQYIRMLAYGGSLVMRFYTALGSWFLPKVREVSKKVVQWDDCIRSVLHALSSLFLSRWRGFLDCAKRLSIVLLSEAGSTHEDAFPEDGDGVLHSQFQGHERRDSLQVWLLRGRLKLLFPDKCTILMQAKLLNFLDQIFLDAIRAPGKSLGNSATGVWLCISRKQCRRWRKLPWIFYRRLEVLASNRFEVQRSHRPDQEFFPTWGARPGKNSEFSEQHCTSHLRLRMICDILSGTENSCSFVQPSIKYRERT